MDANLQKQKKPFESYEFNIFEPSPINTNIQKEKYDEDSKSLDDSLMQNRRIKT